MKRVIFDVNAPDGYIEIVPLADVHIGNEQQDEEYLNAVIGYIENHDNVYTILNGDMVENSVGAKCPSSVFAQTMSPLEQCVYICNLLKNVAQQKKIINCVIGNHDLRGSKETNLSCMDLIVSNLAMYDPTIIDRYCPEGAYSFINIKGFHTAEGTSTVTMFNQHGNSGGMSMGGAVNKLHQMKNIIPAHIYVRSHTHKAETHNGTFLFPNMNKYDVKEERCVFASNGAFILYGGYGLYNGYEPQDNSMPIIKIKITRRNKTVNGKKLEWYDKDISVELKNKEWFMANYNK